MRSKSSRFLDRRRRARGLVAAVTVAVSLPAASAAIADIIDPTRPAFLVVGSPRGASPGERVDAERTGRSKSSLPTPGTEIWNRHVTGGIERSPIVDADGSIIVALSVPEVEKITASGKDVWRVRVSAGTAVQPPMLTSRGTILLLTSSGAVVGLSPSGAQRFSTPLGVRGRELDVAPAALRDGGTAIAAGRTLLELDADGVIRARTTLDERAVGALLASAEGTLVTTESGNVLAWRPPGAPRKLGSLGGIARRGAALADARTVVAVVDGRRIVALDLPTGVARVRSGSLLSLSYFDGPVAIGPGGVVFAATQLGLVVGLDAADNARLQVLVDKPAPMPDAGLAGANASVVLAVLGTGELRPSPPLVTDPTGRVAFLRANGRLGVVGSEGRAHLATERVCSSPVALVPAGEKRMLVACRDGGLFLYGS